VDRYDADGLVFDLTDAGPADGEVIVLLHGFPATRACWDGVVPLLAGAGYHGLAPDQRGYSPGARPPGRRAYRLDRLAGDVVALIDASCAGKVHLVGHDFGAAVAWYLATWHPERLYSVTSLATPHGQAFVRALVSSTQLLQSWYMLFFQLPRLPELALTGPGQQRFRRSLRQSGLSDAHIDRYLSVLAQPGAATAALNWYRALPLLPPSRLRPVTVPTLYVYATGDLALGRKAADLTAREVIAPYRYEVLDGVSHWIPEEAPEVVASLVIEHIRTHNAPQRWANGGGSSPPRT
jgi:pimeloyl-ACP methyl ester carboxylesterase